MSIVFISYELRFWVYCFDKQLGIFWINFVGTLNFYGQFIKKNSYLILSGHVMHEHQILQWLLVIVTIGSWWLFWGWGFFASMGSREKKNIWNCFVSGFQSVCFRYVYEAILFCIIFSHIRLVWYFPYRKKGLEEETGFSF